MVFLCQFLHVYFFSRVDFEVLETGLKSLLKPKIETHDIFPLYVGMLSLNSLIFLLFILKIIYFVLFGGSKIGSLIGHLWLSTWVRIPALFWVGTKILDLKYHNIFQISPSSIKKQLSSMKDQNLYFQSTIPLLN